MYMQQQQDFELEITRDKAWFLHCLRMAVHSRCEKLVNPTRSTSGLLHDTNTTAVCTHSVTRKQKSKCSVSKGCPSSRSSRVGSPPCSAWAEVVVSSSLGCHQDDMPASQSRFTTFLAFLFSRRATGFETTSISSK